MSDNNFMQDQITDKVKWLRVETTQGTDFLPQELVSDVANCDGENVDNMPLWFNKVQQYVEGEPQSWKWIEGYGARLSAPGYLDCTEWTVFDTRQQAEDYLRETYHNDDDEMVPRFTETVSVEATGTEKAIADALQLRALLMSDRVRRTNATDELAVALLDFLQAYGVEEK